MEFTIRSAGIEDAAGIARVQVESWKTTYRGIVPDEFLASMNTEVQTERWREQLVAASTLSYVAEDESGIFGFVSGGPPREGRYDAELYAIYLLKERQRQRAGQWLTLKLTTGLQASGLRSMFVWVLEENPSVSFYRRLDGIQIARKLIEIGESQLREVAFGWPHLDQVCFDSDIGPGLDP